MSLVATPNDLLRLSVNNYCFARRRADVKTNREDTIFFAAIDCSFRDFQGVLADIVLTS
ncbi:MAG: hypothetical protein K8T89_01400 [Planctomycetes bacterium]|nr:hypothetical protein [Planctomycetota bacterium]